MASDITIIGAGMAGLLTAEMLRNLHPQILEAQSALPDNHGALLRFRSDAVARETRQSFRKVRVVKAVKSGGKLRDRATLRDINQYALKVSGTIGERSIMELSPCERYIAPPDFLAKMATGKTIHFNQPFTPELLATLKGQRELATISTIPMPVLMGMVGWDYTTSSFAWRSIHSVSARLTHLAIDVYQTIYYPDPGLPFYRASITGNELIIEYLDDVNPDLGYIGDILDDFGVPAPERGITMPKITRQKYGKLLANDAVMRQEFILAMTDAYNLYSVGRFATWRQLLLDDVVKDVQLVSRMITERSSYRRHLLPY